MYCIGAKTIRWLTSTPHERPLPAAFTPSICWHDICNVAIRGEHMSYKIPASMNRRRIERQQEKLRIARQALARVEAKFAQKQPRRHPGESRAKIGAQRPRTER